MNIYVALIALVGGFVLLVKGADWFVEGSSSVAKLLHVPAIIIGLTVVAFGTSLPEASVSISSALVGKNSLAVSNVVGSNIFNILVVLGASALIAPVCVLPGSVMKEIPFSILCAVVLLITLLVGTSVVLPADAAAATAELSYTLGRGEGLILLAFFAFYMYWQISTALKARKVGEVETDDIRVMSPVKSVIYIVVGITCIILGGNFVVDGASAIAMKFGMSETLVGMTIVAIGTSLPELVTSMVAAKKGESDLALGNAVGSNIFNIIFILGFSSLLSPITVDFLAVIDTVAVIGVSALVLVFAATNHKISRREGAGLVAVYAAYFVYMFIR